MRKTERIGRKRASRYKRRLKNQQRREEDQNIA